MLALLKAMQMMSAGNAINGTLPAHISLMRHLHLLMLDDNRMNSKCYSAVAA